MTPKQKTDSNKSDNKFQTPKGTRDVLGGDFYLFHGLEEKAAEIAMYYGFRPIETPTLEYEELFYRGVGGGTDIVDKELYSFRTKGGDRLALRPEGTAPIMRAYLDKGMQSEPQPVMLYYSGSFYRHDSPQRGRYRQFKQFGFEIIGGGKSIIDAMGVRLASIIIKEAGLKNITFEINSIGDKECQPVFRHELINYYKKYAKRLCVDCRERLKGNPLHLLDCKNPKCQELKADAPNPIGFLCSGCKQHFKEVLEYLEAMGIPYVINNNLVRGLDYYSRTVFEVSELATNENEKPLSLGGGGRYDNLARDLGSKKDIPAFGAALGLDRIIQSPNFSKLTPRILKKPKVFFIQLSPEAKMHSLKIIEVLRLARIPVMHSLSKDSLSAQLAIAEKIKVPYTLILGQKEVLDGTVIVRNMSNRSQQSIEIEKLADYLKVVK